MRAHTITPKDYKTVCDLGRLYHMRAKRSTGAASFENSTMALTWYQKAHYLKGNRPKERYWMLLDLSRLAFTTGADDVSIRFANEALQAVPNMVRLSNMEYAIHFANTLLGRIAMRHEDIIKAKQHLIASANITNCVPFALTGPSMALADELVRHGEVEVVLEYLVLCRRFWKLSFGKLTLWERRLAQGKPPHFGNNVRIW